MKDIFYRLDARSWGIWAFIAAAFLVAYLLYPHPKRKLAESGATEIVFWATNPTVLDELKSLVEEFERRNPEYRVRMGTATAHSNLAGDPTRFLLGVAGGMPPDVIYFDRFAIVELASRGAFTDLNPYLEGDRDSNLADAILEENYYEMAWREPIYKGSNYAIANTVDTRALYYSKASLIRAGFVYTQDDPEVQSGQAKAGDARPPKTWEELCRKIVHAKGNATAGGEVTLEADIADARTVPIRPGDVVALISGTNVFRGRIKSIIDSDRFQIDLARDQRAGLTSLPSAARGPCEIKVFDQDSYVCRLTRFDQRTGLITDVAFIPLLGNNWLYMYGWLNGARFMSDDGERCTLDSPEIVEALQWMVDAYDSIGGRDSADRFYAPENASGIDPFLLGKISMQIHGNWFLGIINAFKRDFEFGVSPAPIPQKRLEAGFGSVGWSGGHAYAMPSTAQHKEGGWKLIRWLSSLEANKMWVESQAKIRRARGEAFFPILSPNRLVMEWIRETYIDNNFGLSDDMVQAFGGFTALLPNSKFRPVTPVGQKLYNEHKRAADAATTHTKPPYDALSYGQRRVQDSLEKFLNPTTGPLVNWWALIALYALGVALTFGGIAMVQERKRKRAGIAWRGWTEGYIAAAPWLIGFVVFGAGPILFSLLISFCHYDVLSPARFVGLDNYKQLLGRHFDPVLGRQVWNDPIFWKSLANTGYMVIGVPVGIVLGLAIAMLLNTKVRGLHIYRTLFYLPAIVPAVATFILWIWLLDPGLGIFNRVLSAFGITDAPNWLRDPQWSKPSLILMGLWGVGASMIIWLAGLKDIPESMYEAAAIDGASRFHQFRWITLPLLSPYIFFNLVMGLIGVFQIFEAAFIMTEGGPADSTLFYAYKMFNEAFRYLNMGMASAMAWLLFVLVLAITLFQLWLGKRWVHYGG